MSAVHPKARPLDSVPYLTRGTLILLGIVAIGAWFALRRFVFGISSTTNLDDQHPWGIWIALDVATGVALAAGGFTSSALAHVFHRDRYLPIVRPALLTALLGYTFVGMGLMFDLGRYYNIWHPVFMWQPNSVLFEVGICVCCYLTVLYIEFLPIVAERFRDGVNLPGPLAALNGITHRMLRLGGSVLDKVLFEFILLGVLLSCMHQSSLGALMLIAPTKMHPLWYTPILPLLFLFSAIAVGFPMVIVESLAAARSFRLKPEMEVLGPLSRFVPLFLALYLAMKVVDMTVRGSWVYLLDGSVQSLCFLGELGLGVVLPLVLILSERVRRNPGLLFTASLFVVLGVAWNRVNVFLVAYRPPFEARPYSPALGEFAITAALVATLILVYRAAVMIFPVVAGKRVGDPVPVALPARAPRWGWVAIPIVVVGALWLAGCGMPKPQAVTVVEETEPVEEVHVCAPCPDGAAGGGPSGPAPAVADPGPEKSVLYHLAEDYAPVVFSHASHTAFATGCDSCHHYASEVDTAPPCRSCHELALQDLRKPGLKGAYHRQCMGCHREMGAGPLGCTDCHEKREKRAAPAPAEVLAALPKEMKLGHLAADYEPVRFDHAIHLDMADSCGDCHHQTNPVDRTPPCRECHNTRESAPAGGKTGLMDAYHGQCMDCHQSTGAPMGCEDCHAPKGALKRIG